MKTRITTLPFLFILTLALLVPGEAPIVASGATAAELQDYLRGELAELELLETPVDLTGHRITFPDGRLRALEDKKGKVLLINLWAKWCIPCRDEMKDLNALQRDLGPDRFEVVALPMKQRSIKSVRKILKAWGATELQPYGNDPQALARVLYDEGLFSERQIQFVYPTTYLVDKTGRILAVREGFLHWDTAEARELVTYLIERRP